MAHLKQWLRSVIVRRPSGTQLAESLFAEWRSAGSEAALADVLRAEPSYRPGRLRFTDIIYQVAAARLALGVAATQSAALAEALVHFSELARAGLADAEQVASYDAGVARASHRLEELMAVASQGGSVFEWARRSLAEEAAMPAASPTTLAAWAQYWLERVAHLRGVAAGLIDSAADVSRGRMSARS